MPSAWRRLSSTAILAIFAGGCAAVTAPAHRDSRAESNQRVFDEAWNLVRTKYYDGDFRGVDWNAAAATYGPRAAAAPDDAGLYREIRSMIELLKDGHTSIRTPAQVTAQRTQQRALTGITIGRIEEKWVVVDVFPKSPAEAAGVKRGWIVARRNGGVIGEGLPLSVQPGEVVSWEFLDEKGQPVSVQLVAKILSTAPRPVSRTLEGGVVYLKFDEFDRDSHRWMSNQLKTHRDAPAVIVDLRANPGGEIFSVSVAVGDFIPGITYVGKDVLRSGFSWPWLSWPFASARYRGRVAILVGERSASSSEIFAYIMQKEHRAIVVGQKTAGAVMGSSFYRLSDGGSLQLSRADFIVPGGRRLEGNGVVPDVAVPGTDITLAELRAGLDSDIKAALGALRATSPAVGQ